MSYKDRFKKRDNVALAIFVIPALFLVLWDFRASHGLPRLLLCCYVLIATPFYLLIGSYPPFGSRWFWKAMLPIAALVALCVFLQVEITNWFDYIEIKLPTRMALSFTSTVALLEGWVGWRIVDATAPNGRAE